MYEVKCREYVYHIVYKITNKVNNKIYIGIHSTNNKNDNYLGSGDLLKTAIKKYGRDKFSKEILYCYETRTQARTMEALIVDSEFCSRKDTYNLAVGGMGVENQYGINNHMYGKQAVNAKKVRAVHKDGRIIETESIQQLAELIQIARGNIRNLINKNIQGKKGWKVTLVEDIV
jgi:hypothetical protein